MPRFTFALVALLLATPALAAPQLAKGYSDSLAKLPEIQRRAALRRAVLDSGEWCKRVEGAAYQGPWKNLQMWVARCGPKPIVDYGVFIGPDGTVQVSSCKEIVEMKLPACRKL